MSENAIPGDDNPSNGGLGNELQYFAEKDICCSIINDLCVVGNHDAPKLLSELIGILDNYLEQPLLIAVHIVELFCPIYEALDSMGKEHVRSVSQTTVSGKVTHELDFRALTTREWMESGRQCMHCAV